MSRWTEAFGDWTPRAVVFDCDGLILDTETVWNETQAEILRRHEATLTAEQDAVLIGATLEVAAETIAAAAGAPYDAVLAETRELFVQNLGEDLRPMPGAVEVVRAAAARVPIACASNSWASALEDKLTRAGIVDLFTVLESTDTVARSKPFPDMYAQGAAALGALPQDALAFEDSATGARAAVSAGLRLVGVPSHGTHLEGTAIEVPTLADPELLAWIGTWPRRTLA
ncbi:HAD family hydrolase [Brachybacterium sp. AOP25-B2-12]|uniref:HAD family hydrolase n=1 Tax=Brachybacterium sp. AOP25-B2-12 TaxID=3457710 RepID=UPI004034BA72